MLTRSGYPAGVPCWVDIIQPDLEATMAFYGGLFGWDFETPHTPGGGVPSYAYATLDGLLVAGVGGAPAGSADPTGWTTYICVDSADETAALVKADGGRVIAAPVDIPTSGRVAVCADPRERCSGCGRRASYRGAQLVNAPGSWNFSELNVPDTAQAAAFYGAVFGWLSDSLEMGGGYDAGIWRVKGYGDFLAEGDPEIRARQEADGAPNGFADAVAILNPAARRRRPISSLERHVRGRRRRRGLRSSHRVGRAGDDASVRHRLHPHGQRSRIRRAPCSR